MTNFQVYKKTLSFSFAKFGIEFLSLLIWAGCGVAGFFIMNKATDLAIVGLLVGLVIGIIPVVLIDIFLVNRFKAAQIAMMTKGVDEGQLPDHTYRAGLDSIKGRFGRITGFYMLSRAIKGVFNQISRAINKVATAVGGQTGNAVSSAVDTAVQILLGYLCDCCMGWVLYRKDINMFHAGCEGAFIFFRHGKTLIRNIGRIFGMGILSLIVIGGALFGAFAAITLNMPTVFGDFAKEIAEIGVRNSMDIPAFLTDATGLALIVSAVFAVILFLMIHGVLVRPFILTGVLRNFIASGKAHIPNEAELAELDSKSPKFAKLRQKAI